jgi:hypothetical protein
MKHPTWWLEVNEEAILQHGSHQGKQKIASKKTWQSSDGGSVQATLLTHRTG